MTKNQCRICLSEKYLVDIFNSTSIGLSTKIMFVANVDIHPNDGLPKTICTECHKRLDDCVQFIQLCKTTANKLRKSILDKKLPEIILVTSQDDTIYECKYSPKSDFEGDLLINNVPSKEKEEKHLKKWESDKNVRVSNSDRIDNNNKLKKVIKQQCSICGRVMSCAFRLRTHLKTHSGERPFSCPHCKKNFTLEQNLKVHMRIHTGEKPHRCSVCGESFAQSGALTVHKRKHTGQTPYYCKLCGKSFRTISNLQYHTRLHTGEKNFECETCGHAFITRSHLKQHTMVHTGEKPHVCCECKASFRRASHLKRHIQRVHIGSRKSCSERNVKTIKESDER